MPNRRHNRPPISYRDSGVDIDAGNALVEAIKPLARSTRRTGAGADLGGFGALFDLKAAGFKDPILVASTDGVGTKLKIAIETGQHDRRHRPGRHVRERPPGPGGRAAVLSRLLRQRQARVEAARRRYRGHCRRVPRRPGAPSSAARRPRCPACTGERLRPRRLRRGRRRARRVMPRAGHRARRRPPWPAVGRPAFQRLLAGAQDWWSRRSWPGTRLRHSRLRCRSPRHCSCRRASTCGRCWEPSARPAPSRGWRTSPGVVSSENLPTRSAHRPGRPCRSRQLAGACRVRLAGGASAVSTRPRCCAPSTAGWALSVVAAKSGASEGTERPCAEPAKRLC